MKKKNLQHTTKQIGEAAYLKLIKENIPQEASNECAYFSGNIEAMFMAFKCYVDGLRSINTSKKSINDYIPQQYQGLSKESKKAILAYAKTFEREIMREHDQILKALENGLQLFDSLDEETKEYCYEQSDRKE